MWNRKIAVNNVYKILLRNIQNLVQLVFRTQDILTLNDGEVNLTHPLGFSKDESFGERVKLWFSVTFDTITSFFSENFIKIPQIVQKMWRFSSSILTIFYYFLLLLKCVWPFWDIMH